MAVLVSDMDTLVLVVSIWAIFSQGIARDLPIGVVDLSHSQLSRQLSRNYDATATLSVTHRFADVAEAKQALVSSQVYAYVVIPIILIKTFIAVYLLK